MIHGFNALPNVSGVFTVKEDPVTVCNDRIQKLLLEAAKTSKKRSRLLLHENVNDMLHEMVIALPKDSFDRPHINFKSGKSFTALRGVFAVTLFSDSGDMLPPVLLSANGTMGNVMVRLNKPTWHTIVPIHDSCVFLETILGPFEGNRFAPFCPGIDKEAQFWEFADRIREKVYHEIFEASNFI